jgi:hypothetical protein
MFTTSSLSTKKKICLFNFANSFFHILILVSGRVYKDFEGQIQPNHLLRVIRLGNTTSLEVPAAMLRYFLC